MRNLILPGFSSKNKEWAEATKQELETTVNFEIISWKHWENEGDFDLEYETKRILQIIGNEKVNVISKSIGTYAAVNVSKAKKFEKFIICGLPLNDLSKEDEEKYQALADYDPKQVICYQNEFDSHGSFKEVEKFVHSISPRVNVIKKPGNTHEYFYSEEFKKFLTS